MSRRQSIGGMQTSSTNNNRIFHCPMCRQDASIVYPRDRIYAHFSKKLILVCDENNKFTRKRLTSERWLKFIEPIRAT